MSILELEWSACSCETCRGGCRRRPCWPSPEEACTIIHVGLGNRLMYDYWVGGGPNDDDIGILSPAIIQYEGKTAPFIPLGPCTFLTHNDLCELHSMDMKPIEGRLVSCETGKTPKDLHRRVAELWNNEKAQTIVKEWTEEDCK